MVTRKDIFNYPYIQVLDVWELDKKGEKKKRRMRIVNVYDNHL